MSELAFRNIDASPTDPVESWPYEGLVTAIERGSLSDWRRIAAAVRRAPWGPVARGLLEYATYGEEVDVAELHGGGGPAGPRRLRTGRQS